MVKFAGSDKATDRGPAGEFSLADICITIETIDVGTTLATIFSGSLEPECTHNTNVDIVVLVAVKVSCVCKSVPTLDALGSPKDKDDFNLSTLLSYTG